MKKDLKKIYHVETIFKAPDRVIQDYLNFMHEEGFDLVTLVGFNRPSVNEKIQDYHTVWKLRPKRKRNEINDVE